MNQAYGGNLRDLWRKSSPLIRVVLCVLVGLVLAGHAQLFGAVQFGKIKRQVGGGRPETAYLKFGSNHADLAAALRIPAVTNNPFLAGFVGPVSILFKSEKEILFVNEAELNSAEYITNQTVSTIATNLTVGMKTNVVTALFTDKSGVVRTNTVTRVERITVRTNISNVSTSRLENPIRLTAKQLRTELVDAIVFGK